LSLIVYSNEDLGFRVACDRESSIVKRELELPAIQDFVKNCNN
jgi:hypothetical protein